MANNTGCLLTLMGAPKISGWKPWMILSGLPMSCSPHSALSGSP